MVFSNIYYPVTIDPIWSLDSRHILYPMPEVEPDGAFGKSQLFRWSREGGPAVQLTHSATGVLYAVRGSDGRSYIPALGGGPILKPSPKSTLIMAFGISTWVGVRILMVRYLRPRQYEVLDLLDQALHHMTRLHRTGNRPVA